MKNGRKFYKRAWRYFITLEMEGSWEITRQCTKGEDATEQRRNKERAVVTDAPTPCKVYGGWVVKVNMKDVSHDTAVTDLLSWFKKKYVISTKP